MPVLVVVVDVVLLSHAASRCRARLLTECSSLCTSVQLSSCSVYAASEPSLSACGESARGRGNEAEWKCPM